MPFGHRGVDGGHILQRSPYDMEYMLGRGTTTTTLYYHISSVTFVSTPCHAVSRYR